MRADGVMGTWRVVGLVVAAAAMLGAGCGSDGPQAQQGSPDQEELTAAEVDRRAAAWAASAPVRYEYVIEERCECDWNGEHRVEVREGEVAQVRSLDPDAERYRAITARSVEGIFDMLREAVTIGASEQAGAGASAAFDPELGHPVAFTVRWGPSAHYAAAIRDLEVLDGPGEPVVEPNVVLSVSNQSFEDPEVHVTVTAGEETIVDRVLEVRDQHHRVSYELRLPAGEHELRMSSDSGATRTQRFAVVDERPTYLAVDYWTLEDGGPSFSAQVAAEPFGWG